MVGPGGLIAGDPQAWKRLHRRDPAFKSDKTALRVTGRFGGAIPTLAKSVRKVQVVAA